MMTPRNEARRAIALTFGYDVLTAIVSMLLALELRWRFFGNLETVQIPSHTFIPAAILFGLSGAIAFFCLKVHRQVWRHSGWPDALNILQGVGLAALIFLPVMFLWNRLDGFPRASLLLCLPVWLGFMFTGRMIALRRSTREPFQIFAPHTKNATRVLLVGDEDALVTAIRNLSHDPEGPTIRVLGMIETSGSSSGRRIRGIGVHGGIDQIGERLDLLKERYGTYPWIATVGKGRSRQVMRQVLAAASARGSEVMSLGASAEGNLLEPIQPEDLLGRRESSRDMAPIKNLVSSTRLFVTGAGGTIGSELIRQCVELEPSHITIFDNSEYNLYQIDLFLRSKHKTIEVETVLGDVRDSTRVLNVMTASKPDIVIHAAALKQVPLMELNPCEAILTNIGGALNTVNAAMACKASQFVFISTDKAVDPDNVMGATKRLAEIAICKAAEGTQMATSMVRFGNVLGSSGSVVPLFERQIAEGGPVTVTHPNITRYFMTVEEAVYLVMQAAAQEKTPEQAALYVLDMGRPVRIQSLAESMIRMKGQVPGERIKIAHTGLRPGDKMHESLTYGHEELSPTDIPAVGRVSTGIDAEPGFELAIESLLKTAAERNPARAVYQLRALVQNYASSTDKDEVASAG